MAKIDRNRNRVPNDINEKSLQEERSQTGYLHDIAEYALFIKEYVAEQKAKGDGHESPTSEIDPNKAKRGSDNFKEHGEFISSISNLISTIDKINPEKFGKHSKVVKEVGGLINEIINNIDTGKKEELEEKMKAVQIVGTFSSGIVNLADNILHAAIKMRMARPFVGMITGTINKLVSKLGTKETIEQSKNAAEALEIISKSILGLSWKIVLAGPLLLIAYPAMIIFGGLVRLTNWAFKHVNVEEVKKGSEGMALAGLSLLAFAGSIVLSSIIMRSALNGQAALGLLMLFSSLTVSLLIFKHLAKDGSELAKGSLAVLAMSGSLMLFSIALTFSAAIIAANPLGIIAAVLTLAAFAATYYFMGKFAREIAMGALTVVAMGFSMWIFSLGMVPLLEVIGKNPATAMASIIGIPIGLIALGTAYSILGAASELIIPGAIAAAAIGGSLWVVGKGLQAMMSLPKNITRETADGWEMGITSVFRGIGKSAGWALLATLAIPSMMMISMSLPGLATGISKFNAVSESWDKEKTDRLSYTLIEITKAYGEAGKVSGINAMKGILFTSFMSHSLIGLSDGVFAWSSQGKMGKITMSEIGNISTNIANVISVVGGAFNDLGVLDKGGKPSNSILNQILGNDFSRGNVNAGISSTKNMGYTLKEMADGVFAWSKNGKMGKIVSSEIKDISTNIASVISVVGGAFNSLGILDKGGKTTSVLSVLVGNDFSRGNVNAGISSTRDMSARLKEIADSVFIWSSHGKMGKIASTEYRAITDNISMVLSALPIGFSNIGKNVGTIWKSDMEKGIAITSQLTPILNSVSTIVYTLSKNNKQSAESIGKDIGMSIQWIAYGINLSSKYLKNNEALLLGNGFTHVGVGLASVNKNANDAHTALSKLLDLQKPLDVFMKLFIEFSKNLKEQQTAINAMQLRNLLAYSKLIENLATLGKSDANVFRENMGYLLGDKLQTPVNFVKENIADNTSTPKRAAQTVAKNIEEKHVAAREHQDKVVEHNESLLDVMNGIKVLLSGISDILKRDNSDALATAIVQKLEHSTSPILVKMKEKMG